MSIRATIKDIQKVNQVRRDYLKSLKSDLETYLSGSSSNKEDFKVLDSQKLDLDPKRLKEKVEARLGRPSNSLQRMWIEPNSEIDFKEGQFITFEYKEHKNDKLLRRSYSIANDYNDYKKTQRIELYVRQVKGGKFTPKLFSMEQGDELELMKCKNGRYVLGQFTLNETKSTKVMLATGAGIAPLRSMIRSVYKKEGRNIDTPEIFLIYCTRWKDDLGYNEEFKSFDDSHENFNYIPILTAEPEWEGRRTYPQETVGELIDKGYIDPQSSEFYICGLTKMVRDTVKSLREWGVDPDWIKVEGYG